MGVVGVVRLAVLSVCVERGRAEVLSVCVERERREEVEMQIQPVHSVMV